MTGDVVAAIATPPGRGAIGVLRVSGRGSLALAAGFIRLPAPMPPRRPVLAWVLDGGSRLDRALVTFFPEGASYTGEESLEVSAHGSPYVLERLLELSMDAGARPAPPGEFTRRAYLNGRLDINQAEAVCGLIEAETRTAHRAAASQLSGDFSRRAEALRRAVLELSAEVEAALDHPEEDIPQLAPEEARRRLDSLRAEAEAMARGARRGRLSLSGARVPLVGVPNAGKSSLLNRLLGRDRAIVSPTPGTTRDTVEEPADLGGLKARLIDTAGLHEGARDPVERAGMERALAAARSADLVVAVLDRTAEPGPQLELLGRLVSGGVPVLAALNKSDSDSSRIGLSEVMAAGPAAAVSVSALRGDGVDELAARARAELLGAPAEEPLACSLRLKAALEGCAAELARAVPLLGADPAWELAASRLRSALLLLEPAAGGTPTEAVLAEVFSRFCVGK